MTIQIDDRHETIEEVGTTEAEAIEVGGIFNQVSEELRAAGLSSSQVEESLGFLEGTTTGAGETLGGILAIYDDPYVIVEAARAIPEAVENFDEIIEALPAAIEDQQQFNNPHEPGDRYYDDFRDGWYQGYFFWFVVEMAVPAGEAGKALKSTDTVQSTVNRISTPQVQRAAQVAKQGGQTVTAPVRYSRQQLSQGLHGSIGLTREAGERVLSEVRTVGGQYQVAKILDRNDVDGGEISRIDGDSQAKTGSATLRSGDDAGRVLADGGPDPVARAYQLDLDVNNENLVSNLFRHSDEIDLERVINDLEELNRPDADIQGVDELALRLAGGDQSNIKGAAFEAEVAVSRGTDNVEAIGKSNPHSRGEIDIETADGRVIETKSGDYTQAAAGSDRYTDLENQIGHYQQYTDAEGGTIEVTFREEPHGDIKGMLDANDVEIEIYNE
ncbi:hypothetical protein [Natronorubrum texcoconense]|uniref:hypothetical protein n=1 Tax=Natronorubrum texcoconense TaxID=1095776 RepID=UPI001FE12B29|nr:hypothetical protein [Natronorubrum texcoconense]